MENNRGFAFFLTNLNFSVIRCSIRYFPQSDFLHGLTKMTPNKILQFIFLFLMLTVFSPLPIDATEKHRQPKVESVKIHGTRQLSKSQVVDKLGIQKGSVFDADQLSKRVQDLLQFYAESGMPYTRLDSLIYELDADSLKAKLRVYVREGRKIKLGNISFSGVDSIKAFELVNQFSIRKRSSFQTEKFENEMENLLTNLENQGHAFAKLDVKSIRLDAEKNKSQNYDIVVKTLLGPQLRLEEIKVEGNDITKAKVIIRECRIKTGEIFSQKKVARIRTRLLKLGYFESVEEPEVYLDSGNRGGLLIRVKEGKASKLDGVLGYNPETETEKGYFTGLLDLSLGNLLGTGRSLAAHWEKRDQRTQELFFHYKEPWVAGLPINIGFGFDQLIQDTTYVQRDWQMNFELPISEGLSAFTRGHRIEITPDSLGSVMFGLPNSRTLSIAFGLDYDTRDDRLNPRKGIWYNTTLEVGKKKNLGPESIIEQYQLKKDIDNKRITLDFEWHFPLFRWQVLSMMVHGRQIKSNESLIPLTDQYRFGGARTMRGYRENQFRGAQVAWTNLEYRYLLGRRSRVFIFLDSGYYSREEEGGRKEGYKLGYGLGLRLETGLGIMGIDYGLGEGDGLFNGKVHVGLINEF